MNYTLVVKGNGIRDDITLGIIERKPEFRPALRQQLEYKGKTYVVAKCSPADNPVTSTVTYYIEKYNPNKPFRNK